MTTPLPNATHPYRVAIIGGGPSGLMAAEVISQAGFSVSVYDAMPSVGRKFLMAGKGGMNITHAEPYSAFVQRYGQRQPQIQHWMERFNADDLRAWIHELGIETFVGSSGRVFPKDMKAAPLLRAWLHRLKLAKVSFYMRHRWLGWEYKQLRFQTPDGMVTCQADATVLALGGGSWARLGSDGTWTAILEGCDIDVRPLKPANCGFNVPWSEHFKSKFAGQPVKTISAIYHESTGRKTRKQGELMITEHGIEGNLVYALSAQLRDEIAQQGSTTLYVDLLPQYTPQQIIQHIEHPRGARSMASHLQGRLGIQGVKAGLLREFVSKEAYNQPHLLAQAIKSLPIPLTSTRPLDEAISSAGGVALEALDHNLMLSERAGVFCAGEMLDWEAPTGGYLLTACFASGIVAGQGVVEWLNRK
jgi:uncharacterized flavoprotein (TIGR03862 family)